MNQTRADLEAFTKTEQRLLGERDAAADANYNNTARLFAFGSVMAAGLLVLSNLMASREVKRRRRSEEALFSSEQRFRLIVDGVKDYAILMLDPQGRVASWNSGAEHIKGYKDREIVGQHFSKFYPPDAVAAGKPDRELIEALARGQIEDEGWRLRKDGSRFFANVIITALRDASGRHRGFAKVTRDITERKRLESLLQQSQKMETVGRLAGGIAHEFNSLLTVIMGRSELLLEHLPAASPSRKNVTEIHKAAERAATLTRQLLASGRKQILQSETINLNALLASQETALRYLAGRGTQVRIIPGPGLHAVEADALQIVQVIEIMTKNAAEAMPHGGELTLATSNVTLNQEYVGAFSELKAGEYAMLAITDTGAGMSEKTKARVFEPFFTTKDIGQGTGLGLSTCYGIIKQCRGHISVQSEPNRGTTFKIFLPQTQPPAEIPLAHTGLADLPHGTETILFVGDDPVLGGLAATLLRRLGYTVRLANGIEALSLRPQDGGQVDLIFTNGIMPKMEGAEFDEQIRLLYPHVTVLSTSANGQVAIDHPGGLNPGMSVMKKPFTPSALAHKIREVLDAALTEK